ncbi:hypothetical protein Hanom_Chr02g00105381 [Helianthus anomalus]
MRFHLFGFVFQPCPFFWVILTHFPGLTQRLFTLTGISYNQAMPMIWRALYTIEDIINVDDLDFNFSEISYLYSLVTHGSTRFLFKAKPHQPLPILKTTQNDSTWKNYNQLRLSCQLSWNKKVGCRLAAFLVLDLRTFKPRIKDSEENTSTSYKASQSLPEPKAVTTRAKAGSKSKKPVEPEDNGFEVKRQFLEFVTERFVRLKANHEKNLAEMEENLASLRSIAVAKVKTITKLEKQKKGLEEQLLYAEVGFMKLPWWRLMRPRTAQPTPLAWDVASWKQILLQLGGEAVPEPVKVVEAGSSGVKETVGGAGEASGDTAVETATVGNEGC